MITDEGINALSVCLCVSYTKRQIETVIIKKANSFVLSACVLSCFCLFSLALSVFM